MAESSSRVRRCPLCRTPIEAESQICSNCGYSSPIARQKFGTVAPIAANIVEVPEVRTVRKTPGSAMVLRLFGVLAIIGSIGFFLIATLGAFGGNSEARAVMVASPFGVLTGALLLAVADIVETLVNIENKLP